MVKLREDEIKELLGEPTIESLVKEFLEQQKSKEDSLEQILNGLSISIKELNSLQSKVLNLNNKELQVNVDIVSLQKEIKNVLLGLKMTFDLIQEKDKLNLPLIEVLNKIAETLSQQKVSDSINNLAGKITPPSQVEWQFKILRDQITGQMETINAKPILK